MGPEPNAIASFDFDAPREEGYDEFYDTFERLKQNHEDNIPVEKDRLEAGRMNFAIAANALAKTFGIEEPLYEIVDGEVKIRSFDISYRGEQIAHSAGGVPVRYDESGALKMDKTV